MRYRSTLFVSRFVQSPSVSYCQIIRQDDSLDLAILEANLNALGMDTNHSEFLLVVSNESDLESLKSKFANELNNGLLKVAIPESVKSERLLNLAVGLASGAVIMTLGAKDQLAPRMTTFIWKELLTENERLLIFEKKRKLPKRIAMFRNTLIEVGGFDEGIKPQLQIQNMIDRLSQIGVSLQPKSHDNLTRTLEKRKSTFSFFKPKPTVMLDYKKVEMEEYRWLA